MVPGSVNSAAGLNHGACGVTIAYNMVQYFSPQPQYLYTHTHTQVFQDHNCRFHFMHLVFGFKVIKLMSVSHVGGLIRNFVKKVHSLLFQILNACMSNLVEFPFGIKLALQEYNTVQSEHSFNAVMAVSAMDIGH